ncbi:MAG TPA: hypothetical protein VF595_10305 [Tepidisphaeraceae bacterium]
MGPDVDETELPVLPYAAPETPVRHEPHAVVLFFEGVLIAAGVFVLSVAITYLAAWPLSVWHVPAGGFLSLLIGGSSFVVGSLFVRRQLKH